MNEGEERFERDDPLLPECSNECSKGRCYLNSIIYEKCENGLPARRAQ